MLSRTEAEMEKQYAEAVVKMKTLSGSEETEYQGEEELEELAIEDKKSLVMMLATVLRILVKFKKS